MGVVFVFFEENNADVSGSSIPESRTQRNAWLINIVAQGWHQVGGVVTVTGHEDGAEVAQALHLGRKRAEALKAALAERGVTPDLIEVVDAAGSDPLIPIDAATHEEQNRYATMMVEKAHMTCVVRGAQ